MRIVSLIAVVLFVSSLAAPARAGMKEDCEQVGDWNLKIRGCTAEIDSGKYSGEDLVFAYNNRCYAYNEVGRHDRAMEDCNQTLRLYPGAAAGYLNRGTAYSGLGDHARAIRIGRTLRRHTLLRLDLPSRCRALRSPATSA